MSPDQAKSSPFLANSAAISLSLAPFRSIRWRVDQGLAGFYQVVAGLGQKTGNFGQVWRFFTEISIFTAWFFGFQARFFGFPTRKINGLMGTVRFPDCSTGFLNCFRTDPANPKKEMIK
jgi:hypothetical protein